MSLQALLRTALFLSVSVCATSSVCAADVLNFTASLTGSQETPPNSSGALGSASVTLNGNILTVNESFSGLSAPATGAHIHCCAAPGSSAPIVVPFPFPLFPNATSGTFNDTFDLSTLLSSAAETSLINGLVGGLAYVNIHDANYPAGEIRGQLVQVASTPEPGTLLLLGSGLLLIVGAGQGRLRRAH